MLNIAANIGPPINGSGSNFINIVLIKDVSPFIDQNDPLDLRTEIHVHIEGHSSALPQFNIRLFFHINQSKLFCHFVVPATKIKLHLCRINNRRHNK